MICAGSPGVRWRSAKTVRATTAITGTVAAIRLRISGSMAAAPSHPVQNGRSDGGRRAPAASHLHVPEDRCAELEHALDVLPERARRDELPPRHVRDLVVGEELDLLRELLLLGGVRFAHPLGPEPLHVLAGRPAEPGLLAGAVDERVDGGVDDVERGRPRVEDVPPALGGRLLL